MPAQNFGNTNSTHRSHALRRASCLTLHVWGRARERAPQAAAPPARPLIAKGSWGYYEATGERAVHVLVTEVRDSGAPGGDRAALSLRSYPAGMADTTGSRSRAPNGTPALRCIGGNWRTPGRATRIEGWQSAEHPPSNTNATQGEGRGGGGGGEGGTAGAAAGRQRKLGTLQGNRGRALFVLARQGETREHLPATVQCCSFARIQQAC